MIRNLLYSLSFHLLLVLVIYINFNSHEFIDIKLNEEPITISFIALEENKELPKTEEKQEDLSSQTPEKMSKEKALQILDAMKTLSTANKRKERLSKITHNDSGLQEKS